MATVKIQTLVQSCKSCGKKLIKGTTYNGKMGSPLIKCRHCGLVQVTPLRVEWYRYEGKALVWLWPVVMAACSAFAGYYVSEWDPEVALVAAVSGLILGLCLSGGVIVQMLLSKRRMRDAAYLQELLKYGAISKADYDSFRSKAR